MKMRLIAAAAAISLSVGSAYAGENAVGGDSPANAPFTKPPTQVTVTPSVIAQAPVQNAPPVVPTIKARDERPILLYVAGSLRKRS